MMMLDSTVSQLAGCATVLFWLLFFCVLLARAREIESERNFHDENSFISFLVFS